MSSFNRPKTKDDEIPDEDTPVSSRQDITAQLQQMVLKGASNEEVEKAIQRQSTSTTDTIRALLEAISTVRNMERRS